MSKKHKNGRQLLSFLRCKAIQLLPRMSIRWHFHADSLHFTGNIHYTNANYLAFPVI